MALEEAALRGLMEALVIHHQLHHLKETMVVKAVKLKVRFPEIRESVAVVEAAEVLLVFLALLLAMAEMDLHQPFLGLLLPMLAAVVVGVETMFLLE